MKTALLYFGLAFMGLLAGGLSALQMSGLIDSKSGVALFEVNIDHWASDWSIGSKSADGYTRARVARYGLLGLAKSEAVYFVRSRDEAGAPLEGRCTYVLSGTQQDALWWSITLYDQESRLPMNDDRALSIDSTQVGSDGPWQALVSPSRPQTGHWISSRAAKTFDLTLRLYQPSDQILTAPEAAVKAPSLQKLSCEAAS